MKRLSSVPSPTCTAGQPRVHPGPAAAHLVGRAGRLRVLTRRQCAAVGAVLGAVLLSVGPAAALDDTITYQGQIRKSGVPLDDTCDFEFSLWDAAGSGSPPSGGNKIATQLAGGWPVADGMLTVTLAFGPDKFTGENRWLQIALRCPDGSGPYTTLGPRQQLTASPYALYAPAAATAATASDVTCSGCVGGNDLASGAVTFLQIAPGTIQQSNLAFNPGSVTQVSAGLGLTGGTITTTGTIAVDFGATQGTVAEGDHTHGGTFWQLGGNAGTNAATHYLGTSDGTPLVLRVGGSRALRIEPAASPNLLGGWASNEVSDGAVGAVIGGGGGLDEGVIAAPNMVTDNFGVVAGGLGNTAGNSAGGVGDSASATVGGGARNSAQGPGSTVGGGVLNTAGGEASTVGGGRGNEAAAMCATIAGGCRSNGENPATRNRVTDEYGTVGGGGGNRAGDESTADASYATVAGGGDNIAAGKGAAVGGGGGNQATGEYATVPGGALNIASGAGSFAAGRGAWATHDGSFVWGDGTWLAASQGANTFNALASGGYRFYLDAVGNHCDLTSTAAGWQCFSPSDRNAKTRVAPVDGADVLLRLATVPVQTWSYTAEKGDVRHVGPMAQDFHAAFGVGENDREINTVDAVGVALASIQGLHRLVQEKDAQIRDLERRNAALDARVAALEALIPARIAALGDHPTLRAETAGGRAYRLNGPGLRPD